ncbi:L-aspartate oxidase [Rhizobium sp. C1]|uniref:L-aspartate oxidase n=1 Tax=Rhizobium sp. C1 TaxID=1349799 RepID=UPI001E30676B|nr:L-aspartate oxidase [Rhizobium sp. C1]MCD2177892.1 L-aspartate oxidase [Rhizobium sp. C1]
MTALIDRLAGRVVVVGSGIAGLTAALSLAPRPVVLLTRGVLGAESSSGWAQGGIAAALGPDDSTDLHLADTLAAGDGLCDAEAARAILSETALAFRTLERFGVRFDRKADGDLQFGLEAAHSRNRIIHANGDGTGAAIVRALTAAVRACASITVLEGVEVRRLLTAEGAMAGLLCVGSEGAFALPTTQVVLATGGLGGIYDASTNPAGNFGQGVMLAARAGAELCDMEFVQFHPTALATPRRPLALVSEAVRGEGALLLNERGERFLADTPGAELAPRDVVARAIGREIARGGKVYLDARDALGSRLATRFPLIHTLCAKAGIDPARDLIPVRPAAHYHMGGVTTDTAGRSTIDGLWVIGEAACTGLHGANRLASNSLLEGTVMGIRAAQDITGAASGTIKALPDIAPGPAPDLRRVREIASRDLSVVRNQAGLDRAIADLLPLASGNGPSSDPALVALAITVFARLREESRGAHARSDFPAPHAKPERRTMTLADLLETAQGLNNHPLAESA